MVTSAPQRRFAYGVVALAFAGPAVLLGGVAWADPSPAPADNAATDTAPAETPAVQPSVGSWIIGGTLLEGSAGTPAKPATKPVAKPAAKPAAQPAVVAPARTTTRTSTRTTTRRSTGGATTSTPTGPSALPFTGNHLDALLPAGLCFLGGGVMFVIAGRPRRATA